MRTVRLTVFGLPQPKGSTRAFKCGPRIVVTSDNSSLAKWEAAIRTEAQRVVAEDPRLFDGPVALELIFALPRPASVSRRTRPLPTTRPDLSKLIRAAEDPLTGVLWRDDAQVVSVYARKIYTDGPAKAEIVVIQWSQPRTRSKARRDGRQAGRETRSEHTEPGERRWQRNSAVIGNCCVHWAASSGNGPRTSATGLM